LDCYLAGASCTNNVIAAPLQNIYTPNVLVYAASLSSCSNCPPSILVQPAGLTVRPGTNVTFSVTATGTQPLSYQWRKNGANLGSGGRISGATSASLTISNVVESDSGQYSVLVTNTMGSVLSTTATLLVTSLDHFTWSQIPSPQFTNAPSGDHPGAEHDQRSVSNFVGTVTMSGSAGSTAVPLRRPFQATSSRASGLAALTLPRLPATWCCALTMASDTLAKQSFPSGFSQPSPVITAQPVNVAARQGTNVTFNMTAAGAPPLSYQWLKAGVSLVDGGKISGATTPSLTISNVANKDAGSYSVLVTNNYGSTLSSNATLVILRGKAPRAPLAARLPVRTSRPSLSSASMALAS